MIIVSALDLWEKLRILGMASSYDACAPPSIEERRAPLPGIFYAWAFGTKVPLLKVLLTNGCSRNCKYCAFSSLVDHGVSSFEIKELVGIFMDMWRKGLVQGLFLSSAIPGHPDNTMEKMISVARILREREEFKGYIHLKILPGTSQDMVRRALPFATRVSINLEAPREEFLKNIAPSKSIKGEILPLLPLLKEGFTTQFVVDIAPERDLDLLNAVEILVKRYGLKRAYFQTFRPIPGTPLGDHPPGSKARQMRLYQGEFLVRRYAFSPGELIDSEGNLPKNTDPKTFWVRNNPHFFPLDLEDSTYHQLLRVPGIGPKLARRIIALRRKGGLSPFHIEKAGINLRKSGPYLLYKGKPLVKGFQVILPLE